MSYDILFSESADKQLKKLPLQVQQRIVATIKRIRVRPHSFVKKIVSSPYYRLRVGDYRVILDIADGKLIIHVIVIGHRKNIYKNLKT